MRWWATLALALAAALPEGGGAQEEIFQQGNQLYQAEDYAARLGVDVADVIDAARAA